MGGGGGRATADLEARWRAVNMKAATQGMLPSPKAAQPNFLTANYTARSQTLRRNKSTNNIWAETKTQRIKRAVGPSSPTLRGAASRMLR